MNITTITEVLDAAHLTHYISSNYSERGGIMVIGPPGVLKTALIKAALEGQSHQAIVTDLNMVSLKGMRDSMLSGSYKTLAFPDFQKLYERKAESAANVIGVIKALIDEGFNKFATEATNTPIFTIRCLIMAAMTYSFYMDRIDEWRASGLERRCLWPAIKLKDPHRMMEYAHKLERIKLNGIPRIISTSGIPFDVSETESKWLLRLSNLQDQELTPFILLKKIFAVLKFKYFNDKEKAVTIIEQFCQCINGGFGELEI
jgi:hypothetical protein